ncbi:Uncharacterised protein [Moraxella cuniculi]|uniref:Uncharacterized protein n=2 Tax=Moraxella cuniculi TaxID=34061 RepID=A0A3S4QQY4_9GAMM|nr:Uncharacterised protein [Moraxella cuniculi]
MKISFVRLAIIVFILIVFGFYFASMKIRGLDVRKDSYFGESMGDIPFKYNSTRKVAVTQSVTIKSGEVIHSVYIFKFYGVFYRKKLVFKFRGSPICNNYSSQTVNSWLVWESDKKLKMSININTIQEIFLQKKDYKNVRINYQYYSKSCVAR